MTELGANRYGKQSIRLVRVVRGPVHRVRDLTVDVALEGGFDAAFIDGDNALVVATDTMKNTVYAFATEHLDGAIEPFAAAARDATSSSRRRSSGRRSRSASTPGSRCRRRPARRPTRSGGRAA